jgi:hypothetical protein
VTVVITLAAVVVETAHLVAVLQTVEQVEQAAVEILH